MNPFDAYNRGFVIVTVNVNYYNPDFTSIVQEFIWQTYDKNPKYPRVHKFLDYWKEHIDAVIQEVYLMDHSPIDRKPIRKS